MIFWLVEKKQECMGTYKKRYSYITEEIEIFYYVAQCQTFAKAARKIVTVKLP
tara:strand:- start:398 stop:556 length:159 start_codon:yes stop_codon:yes gene_type:complete